MVILLAPSVLARAGTYPRTIDLVVSSPIIYRRPCHTCVLSMVADTGELPNPTISTSPSPRLSMSSEYIWFLGEIEPSYPTSCCDNETALAFDYLLIAAAQANVPFSYFFDLRAGCLSTKWHFMNYVVEVQLRRSTRIRTVVFDQYGSMG